MPRSLPSIMVGFPALRIFSKSSSVLTQILGMPDIVARCGLRSPSQKFLARCDWSMTSINFWNLNGPRDVVDGESPRSVPRLTA